MLHGKRGASMLRRLRRQKRMRAAEMASFRGPVEMAAAAWSTVWGGRGVRRQDLSTTTKLNEQPRSRTTKQAFNLQQAWDPRHGIVFADTTPKYPSRSTARSYTTVQETSTRTDQGLHIHSNAEDNYVLANSIREPFAGHSAPIPPTPEAHPPPEDTPKTTEDKQVTTDSDAKPSELPESASLPPPELPETTSSYKMSPDLFAKALAAPEGHAGSYWSHTMYIGPSEKQVTVHYCKSRETSERVAQKFLNSSVLGFDMEWYPNATRTMSAKKNVSLIQIANEERIALFHLAAFSKNDPQDLVAPTLQKILEDESVTKAGVCIKGDCTRLRNFLHVDTKGIFELSHLYKLIKYSETKEYGLINKRPEKLATLVHEHLGLPMYKGEIVRGSDWSQPLNVAQILYAASDSYAGYMLFDVMDVKRQKLDPVPPRPWNADLNRTIRLAEGVVIPVAESAADEETEGVVEAADGKDRNGKALDEEVIKAGAENVEIEPEPEGSESAATVTYPTLSSLDSAPAPSTSASLSAPSKRRTTTTRSSPTKSSEPSDPPHPLLPPAQQWTQDYLTTHPKSRCLPSQLRAYALWAHNPDLSVQDVAKILRNPPLALSTVQNYILTAVAWERLPCHEERVRGWPREMLGAGRYGGRFAGLGGRR